MNSVNSNIASANWQVTASTVECELVREYVTIMVNKDWSSKCVWWAKNKNLMKDGPAGRSSLGSNSKSTGCQGPDCKHVQQYRDKLIDEEQK
jgi:hypothetical protein